MKKLLGLILISLFVSGMGVPPKKEEIKIFAQKGNLIIKSLAFKNQEYIPKKYTADGADINPPLTFENVPEGTKSLVLIVDDPDAPMGTWDHWIVFNIPPEAREIKEGETPKGSLLGINDFRKLEYGGPSPPPGKPHRYFFKLYALDSLLLLKEGIRKEALEKAMEGHVLAQTSLVGLYKR